MTEVVTAPPERDSSELGQIGHWIGGAQVAGTSGRTGPVYNPATGEQTKEVAFASVEEVDAAVRAAAAAFPAWRATSLSKRTEIFFRIRELVHDRREDIARILTDEHGKVLSDAMGEVQRGLEVIEFACGIPTLMKGGFSEQAATGIDVYSIRQPLGVVAGITPFNFPAMVPMWMWAPALACGNAFVLKPSEKDPSAVSLHGRAAQGGGRAGRRLQRRPGRQGGGRRDPRAPGHRGGELRRLDADRPLHLRERDEARQARPGARRREEPHDRAARRRRRDGGGRCGLGGLRVGRRALHGRLGRARGRRCGGAARRGDQGAAAEDHRRARPRGGLRDGPAHHARAPRQGRLVHRVRGATRARRSSSTGARRRRTATASSSACRCSTR